MKLYGYEKNKEEIIELSEVSVVSSISDIIKLKGFLEHCLNTYSTEEISEDIIHLHYRDWNKEWKNDDADIVVVPKMENLD